MVFGAKAVNLSPVIASMDGKVTRVSSSVSIHFVVTGLSINYGYMESSMSTSNRIVPEPCKFVSNENL